MKNIFHALRLLCALSLLTGFVYPLLVLALGQAFFPWQCEGSLLETQGHLVGSALIAQKTQAPEYFWPRPSACDYATIPSGASNLPWTSAALHKRLREDGAGLGLGQGGVSVSASGLDPDQPLAEILAQLGRVAKARAWTPVQAERCKTWVLAHASGGNLGPVYVNVLSLNLALPSISNGQ